MSDWQTTVTGVAEALVVLAPLLQPVLRNGDHVEELALQRAIDELNTHINVLNGVRFRAMAALDATNPMLQTQFDNGDGGDGDGDGDSDGNSDDEYDEITSQAPPSTPAPAWWATTPPSSGYESWPHGYITAAAGQGALDYDSNNGGGWRSDDDNSVAATQIIDYGDDVDDIVATQPM